MDMQVIKTERDYQKALMRIEIIFDAKKGSKEGDELEFLSLLIDKYEKENQLEDFPDSNS
jgi:HTH-type transcriptional regulator/antitoxin HigA